jgi:hypothetical protein
MGIARRWVWGVWLLAGCGGGMPEGSSPSFSPGAPQVHRQGRVSAVRGASGPGRPLVPPLAPGASRASFEGCLSLPSPSEDSDTRFPATVGVRALTDHAPVTTRTTATGLLLEHPLDHGCGLTARVDSYLRDGTVTVTETLSGGSGRCMCHSTVRTSVRLPPGAYTLRVITLDHGTRTVAHEGPVTVSVPRE